MILYSIYLVILMMIYINYLFLVSNKNKEKFSNQNKTNLSCDETCKEEKKQIINVLNYDPNRQVHKNLDELLLVGKSNSEDLANLTDIQSRILSSSIDILRNQTKFIIFFDKADYLGKMYLIPLRDYDTQLTNKKQTNDLDMSSHIDYGTFVKEFAFYFGRQFSCIVPANVRVEIIPLQREYVPSETMILRTGQHASIRYYLASIGELKIITNKK